MEQQVQQAQPHAERHQRDRSIPARKAWCITYRRGDGRNGESYFEADDEQEARATAKRYGYRPLKVEQRDVPAGGAL